MKKEIKIGVEMPEGFEETGEYRQPRTGEWFLNHTAGNPGPYKASGISDSYINLIIIRKKPWRADHEGCYFFVSDKNGATDCTERDEYWDKMRYENGNYYRSMSEAKEAAERVRKAYRGTEE